MKSILYAFLFAVITASGAAAQGTYQNIDVPASAFTYAYGINSQGEIVGAFDDNGLLRGFVFSGGMYTAIDYPGGQGTAAIGINDVGQIVGNTVFAPQTPGFIYGRASDTFTLITYPGSECSGAVAINNNGRLLGVACPFGPSDPYPFEQDPSGRQKLFSIPGTLSLSAFGLDDSGVILGYFFNQRGSHNFKYTGSKVEIISIPGVPYGLVCGTNPKGTALVGAVLPGAPTDSFLYENGTVQTIAYPGARNTYAFAVNNSGEVTGFYYYDSGGPHGFLWTPSDNFALQ